MASLLFAYLFLLFIWTRVDGESNLSISLGSSLVAGAHPRSAWYSESRLFAFGFHPQGAGYVVAIWLPSFEDNENNVVWSLYRDESPVSQNATLKLTHKGELVLFSGGVSKSIAANISYAVMNNSGNFVLYNDHTDIVWQSFDSPTDTILQGQSLLRGKELVSSVSKTNYSSGRFCIKMDINVVMYPINMVDQIYWVSPLYFIEFNNYMYLDDKGLWNSNENYSYPILSLNTEPANNVIYGATLGDYGVFRLYSFNYTNSTFSRSLVWKTPNQPCDVPSVCGCNSYCTTNDKYEAYCVCLPGSDFVDPAQNYNGCERNYTKSSCVNGKENKTYYNMVANDQLEINEHSYYVSTGNEDYCKQSCLEDCFCDAAVLRDNNCSKYKFPLRYVKKGDSGTILLKMINKLI